MLVMDKRVYILVLQPPMDLIPLNNLKKAIINSLGYLDTYHEGYKHLILMLVMDKGSS